MWELKVHKSTATEFLFLRFKQLRNTIDIQYNFPQIENIEKVLLGLFPQLEENASRKDFSIWNIEKSTKNSGTMIRND